MFTYDNSHIPEYYDMDEYLEQLRLDKNNFVTNPTYLSFDNYNETNVLVIHSGDRIEEEYICNFF